MTSSQTIDLSSAISYSNTQLESVVCDTKPYVLIYWGDGTTPIWTDCKDPALLKHTYAAAKKYTIELRGTVAWFSAHKQDSSDCLSNFLTSFTIPWRCPIRTFIANGKVDTLDTDGPFANCSKLTSFKGDLFSGAVTTQTNENWYDGLFRLCTSLKSIPDYLYQSLKPNTTDREKFVHIRVQFSESGLTTIPSTLYARFPENITKVNINGSLRKLSISSIPSNLFSNLPPQIEVFDPINTFYRCVNLTEIPANLFDGRDGLTFNDFSSTFAVCTGIAGEVPKLWEKYPDSTHKGTFYECTNASNYAEIPEDWKRSPLTETMSDVDKMKELNMYREVF